MKSESLSNEDAAISDEPPRDEVSNDEALNEALDDESSDPVFRDFVVPDSAANQRIDLFLTSACDGYSRTQIRQAVQEDQAAVDGRTVRPSFRIKAGQTIRFQLPEAFSDEVVPENIPLDLLYEDDGFVVVNKPPGMVVHPARGNWQGTLTSALAHRFQCLSDVGGPTRPGIVHRLDRDTSGVIVVAKTNAVHMALAQQWHDREVEKEYFAITVGRLDRDRDVVDAPIGRHPYQRDKMAIRENHPTTKPASTFYEVMERIGRFTLVRVRPKTGRTHQIRVHLAHLGCPILCDRLYAGHAVATESWLQGRGTVAGSPEVLDRQALHARRLTLCHPQSGESMTFEAPLPDDLERAIQVIRQREHR
ncbi:RluA family pseudouridine synthase [Stieleria magnilauensis]|uniref:Pseudouridine synthase n=1 Tax=Stieleria magnilauensis TaxID=2527963 RepID=A0ABX5XL74_9BACT|nr:Pseudouridine synthase [Planctomycetes bacterium TBK1r]